MKDDFLDKIFISIELVYADQDKMRDFKEESIKPRLIYHLQSQLNLLEKGRFFVDSELSVQNITMNISKDKCESIVAKLGQKVDVVIHDGNDTIFVVMELKTTGINKKDMKELRCITCHSKPRDFLGVFLNFESDKCDFNSFKNGVLDSTYMLKYKSKPETMDVPKAYHYMKESCTSFRLYKSPFVIN